MGNVETLTVSERDNGIFRIAYDGQILGDDRGFSSRAACETEIDNRIARDAARFDRPLLYRKG